MSVVARPSSRVGAGSWWDRVHRGAVVVENEQARKFCITIRSPEGDLMAVHESNFHAPCYEVCGKEWVKTVRRQKAILLLLRF